MTRIRRATTTIAAAFALLPVACDQPATTSERLESGVYDDQELDHFFNDAENLLGDRIGWTEIGDVKDLKQVVRIGAVDMSERDRTKLEGLAPHWVEVDAFETEYSEGELKGFGRDAVTALEGAELDEYLTSTEIGIDTLWVSLSEDRSDVREVLDEALPAGVYRIEVSEGGSI